jgi:hypothetical protein
MLSEGLMHFDLEPLELHVPAAAAAMEHHRNHLRRQSRFFDWVQGVLAPPYLFL